MGRKDVLNSTELLYVMFKESRNRFRQDGNRFLGSLKGFQIRAQVKKIKHLTLCTHKNNPDDACAIPNILISRSSLFVE